MAIMTNIRDNNAKLKAQLTRWQNEAHILTALLKSQQTELQRLRAINARLMAERKRKYTLLPKPHVRHS